MRVRALEESDIPQWIDLRAKLWPEQSRTLLDSEGRQQQTGEPPLVVFVADDDTRLVGFIEVGLRSVAEGCESSPAPYVEGWYVEPEHQRRGIGRALMREAERWARANGYTEMGSDAQLDNTLSHRVHAALGFEEVERLVVFRKSLH